MTRSDRKSSLFQVRAKKDISPTRLPDIHCVSSLVLFRVLARSLTDILSVTWFHLVAFCNTTHPSWVSHASVQMVKWLPDRRRMSTERFITKNVSFSVALFLGTSKVWNCLGSSSRSFILKAAATRLEIGRKWQDTSQNPREDQGFILLVRSFTSLDGGSRFICISLAVWVYNVPVMIKFLGRVRTLL